MRSIFERRMFRCNQAYIEFSKLKREQQQWNEKKMERDLILLNEQ